MPFIVKYRIHDIGHAAPNFTSSDKALAMAEYNAQRRRKGELSVQLLYDVVCEGASKQEQYISGEFEVADIDKASFKEIFFSDSETADKWYKAKLAFITIDEKTDKEKRSTVNYLVQAASLNGAVKNIDEVMGGTMIDYVQCNVSETPIMDVFEYVSKEKKEDSKV